MVAEKRSQGRLLTNVTVSAIVETVPDDSVNAGTLIICQTHDMSLAGMCLLSEEVIPRGSRLQLDVRVVSIETVFSHRAEVIWCRVEDEGYLIGLHIMESMCDEQAWKNMVIDILVG